MDQADVDLADTQLEAGKIDFEFTNRADDISELYVLRASGDVVGEVEVRGRKQAVKVFVPEQ